MNEKHNVNRKNRGPVEGMIARALVYILQQPKKKKPTE